MGIGNTNTLGELHQHGMGKCLCYRSRHFAAIARHFFFFFPNKQLQKQYVQYVFEI